MLFHEWGQQLSMINLIILSTAIWVVFIAVGIFIMKKYKWPRSLKSLPFSFIKTGGSEHDISRGI